MIFKIARLAAIALLFAALDKQPHVYYLCMKTYMVGLCAYGAYHAKKLGRSSWCWVFGVIAALYLPFVKLHLGKENWQPLDMIVAMIFILSFYLVREGLPMHTHAVRPSESL